MIRAAQSGKLYSLWNFWSEKCIQIGEHLSGKRFGNYRFSFSFYILISDEFVIQHKPSLQDPNIFWSLSVASTHCLWLLDCYIYFLAIQLWDDCVCLIMMLDLTLPASANWYIIKIFYQVHKIERSQWEPTSGKQTQEIVPLLVFSVFQEWWLNIISSGREVLEGGDICICRADSVSIPPEAKSRLIEKTMMLRKIEGKRKNGQ